MISSAVRGVLQTVVAVMFFGDIVDTSRAFGILMILLGSSMYAFWRNQELQKASTSLLLPLREREGVAKD